MDPYPSKAGHPAVVAAHLDSSPVLVLAAFMLLYCRRYRPDFTLGELGLLMAPYAGMFLAVTTCLMLLWFKIGLPFGF